MKISFCCLKIHTSIKHIIVLFLLIATNKSDAQTPVSVHDGSFPLQIGRSVEILNDPSKKFNATSILHTNEFKQSEKSVPIFLSSESNIWLRYSIKNLTADSLLYLTIQYSNISNIWVYKQDATGQLKLLYHAGNAMPFAQRGDNSVYFNFPVPVTPQKSGTYYLHVNSTHPVELPLFVNNAEEVKQEQLLQALIIGLYCGIILSVLLYNLFLYFSTRDNSYLIYVLYLFFLGLAQVTFAGWSFKVFWSDTPSINSYAVIISSALAGIAGILFAKSFLHTGNFTPVINKVLSAYILIYIVALALGLSGFYGPGYGILNYNGIIAGLTLLYVSVVIAKKGFRPAYFYFIAWSFFLVALVIFILRNLSILPTNSVTHFAVYIGSAIEAVLLSIALADKINTLSKEKEESQLYALKIARENETLIKEQNIVLEQKVAERTDELQKTNKQLSKALGDLQDAQIQLVEAEKMASLGQLTAGIAHEINNPINFVKSNIKPLRLDINDIFDIVTDYNQLHNAKNGDLAKRLEEVYEKEQSLDVEFIKAEIQQLLKGIEEGAERTAEIVRGLKTFSRLDEAELKTANIHDGIESTLVLLRNSMPKYIKIEKKFCANGEIDCLPGKLNQVFMNIINNGIQAIAEKEEINEEELIVITTKDTADNHVRISIKDTGKGMTEQVKHRVFEPFFTTKAVGEGTGLGMAIVFKIIEEHHGKIDIMSEPGKGAEFIITLPRLHSIS